MEDEADMIMTAEIYVSNVPVYLKPNSKLRKGNVQVWFPEPVLIKYLPADLDKKLFEILVSVKGQAVLLTEVEDTCTVSEPLPAFYDRKEPGYLGKQHLSERERQIDFYTNMLLDLEDDVGFVKRILEVLHSGKKGVALDGLPNFGALLRHKGNMLFLGEWTKEEKKQFYDNYSKKYPDYPVGDYELVMSE